MQSLFPTTERLLAAAEHYLGLIETSEDLVYWPRDMLTEATMVLQTTVLVQSKKQEKHGWLDVDEELRPPPRLTRFEQALELIAVVWRYKTT